MFSKKSLFTLTLLFILILIVGTVHAQPLNAPQDVTIGDGTAASCETQEAANALSSAVNAGGTIDFDCGSGMVTINANTNVTDQNVVINGGGNIVLSGEDSRQLFLVLGTGNLTLNDIQLFDGNFGSGGGIYVSAQANVTINGGYLTSNHAATNGGGIYNEGTVTINRTTFGSNSTTGNGGAIYNNGGTVNIHNAYFNNNQAISGGAINQVSGTLNVDTSAFRSHTVGGVGAAIYIQGGTTEIENTTFSNNQANQGAGIYKGSGTLTMAYLTFNENRGDFGAAIYNASGTTNVGNSIFTGSLDEAGVGPSLNCDGPAMTSDGHNIISDNSCVPNPGTEGDLHATPALLGGWQLPEHAYFPASNSPALDYGINCLDIDQRGFLRPFGNTCDVGAVERYWTTYLPIVVK